MEKGYSTSFIAPYITGTHMQLNVEIHNAGTWEKGQTITVSISSPDGPVRVVNDVAEDRTKIATIADELTKLKEYVDNCRNNRMDQMYSTQNCLIEEQRKFDERFEKLEQKVQDSMDKLDSDMKDEIATNSTALMVRVEDLFERLNHGFNNVEERDIAMEKDYQTVKNTNSILSTTIRNVIERIEKLEQRSEGKPEQKLEFKPVHPHHVRVGQRIIDENTIFIVCRIEADKKVVKFYTVRRINCKPPMVGTRTKNFEYAVNETVPIFIEDVEK